MVEHCCTRCSFSIVNEDPRHPRICPDCRRTLIHVDDLDQLLIPFYDAEDTPNEDANDEVPDDDASL